MTPPTSLEAMIADAGFAGGALHLMQMPQTSDRVDDVKAAVTRR